MKEPTQIERLQALLRKATIYTKPRMVQICFDSQTDKSDFRNLLWGIKRSGEKNTPKRQFFSEEDSILNYLRKTLIGKDVDDADTFIVSQGFAPLKVVCDDGCEREQYSNYNDRRVNVEIDDHRRIIAVRNIG